MSDQNVQRARQSFASILSYYENRSSSGSSSSLPPPDWARGARSAEYGDIVIGYISPRPPTVEQATQAQQHLSDLLRSQETRDRLSQTERQLFTMAASEPIVPVNRHPPDPPPPSTNQPSTNQPSEYQPSPRPSNPPPPPVPEHSPHSALQERPRSRIIKESGYKLNGT
ncbi:hypothetical protein EMCG_05934 [[Emmonsia] crescens]|uniref:Uncharacterized protein n=1 Tax=[Emmonsia] crescens TaxID=73230 RepID=A0A0G2IDX0_9EURO|nr:hypothetical protein EMCG_05934 [Emmonsia crescens UAMH 3008]